MTSTSRNIFHIVLVAWTVIILTFSVYGQSGTTQYIYDNNGRLKAVTVPTGETVVYEYDAAGNLVSITRQNNPIVSLSGFVPNREFVGSQVTIQGSGFIPDVNQNQVKFNGSVASIVSATVNELTAIVPDTATTGKITVSNINGSAESGGDFTPLRTIIPNDPPVPLAFDSVNQNYVFRFGGISGKNISLLFTQINSPLQIKIYSPTGVVITPGVPNPFNGKVFIDRFQLTETGNYEVEITSTTTANPNFSLYQFDDITGDIPSNGVPLNVAILPGQNAALNLNISLINQPTFLNISGTTVSDFFVLIKSPTGAIVRAESSNTPNKIIQLQNLPVAGNYRVEFNPRDDSIGNVSFRYSLTASNSIVIDGPALSLTIFPNQAGEVTFTGNAGQRVFIELNTGAFSTVNISVIRPNGSVLNNSATASNKSAIDINRLPETGTYRIIIEPMSTFGSDVTISAASTASIGGDCFNNQRLCFVEEIFAVADQSVDLNLEVVAGDEPPPTAVNTNKPKTEKITENSLTPVNIEFSMSEVNVAGEITIFDANDNQVASFSIASTSVMVTFDNPGFYRIRITPSAGQTGKFKFRVRNTGTPPGS